MTAMNRFSYLYSPSCKLAQSEERGVGLCGILSSIDKHKRENCVMAVELQR